MAANPNDCTALDADHRTAVGVLLDLLRDCEHLTPRDAALLYALERYLGY